MISSDMPRSADVELWLHCGGQRFELGQVGGEILILAKPEPIPGGEAVVETIIDGHSQRFSIGVIAAHSGESKRIAFSRPS
ncbi:hypothetical protein [Stieleria varia]|uniref:Uncharacterized protein n=1 Tax=Stieleria varia TaxID=2528005 RepID=A0A5C6AZA9_9BACT|nr:hypothetical protein [Stieleria varia]TWU04817.1 hypothetical protein Pla52n_28610 [Stieleria varia]